MDITRNWRLKTSRSQLLATRHPQTGAVMLPQQTPSALVAQQEIYVFETLTARPRAEAEYARAAR